MKAKQYLIQTCLLGALLSASPAQAQFLWSERIASATNWPEGEPNTGLALDTNDNCYVTGYFDDTNNFGGVTLTNQSVGGSDIFVAKYNATGALQWAQRAGGTSSNYGRGIGVDTNGNIYVTGGYSGSAKFGAITLPAPSGEGFFLAKYNNAGAIQWVRSSTGGSDDNYGIGLTVDNAGNSYALAVMDHSGTSITFGSKTVSTVKGGTTLLILVKYDNTGTAQWAQLFDSTQETYGSKVAVDAAGNVYVRGTFFSDMTIGASNLVVSPAGSTKNMFIAKFNNSGALVWVQQPTGGDVDEGGVAVDPAGNVYVTGAYDTNLNFGSGIILTNKANSNAIFGDAFLAKYNGSGTIQWARQAGGTNGGFYWDLALDGQTNIYAAGFLGYNAAVAKYSPAGALQWVYSASGLPASPVASGVVKCVVDTTGHCYLNGFYQGTATFGTTTLQPQETWNLFLAEIASYNSFNFGLEVQSTPSASIIYDSETGISQYTDAASSTEDYAYLPITGSSASFVTTSNGWTTSLAANISTNSLPCASGKSDHIVMGLGIFNGFPTNIVAILLAQENNTGGGDDAIYPPGWYGTTVRFLANKNGSTDITTPLGSSLPSSNGSVYLPLLGGTNALAGTETIGAVNGDLTLNYNASTKTVTSYYDGMPVGSYSLAGWGINPPLTLVVWGGSGSGVNVPAGADTANNFFASVLPQMTITFSSDNAILTWPTNAAGFTLQSTTNLSSATWSAVSPTPVIVNGQNTVTNSISSAARFYRLAP